MWLDRLYQYPLTTLQGHIDNEFTVVTQDCCQLFNIWGNKAQQQSSLNLAQRCFRKIGDLRIQLGERSSNLRDRACQIKQGADSHIYADKLIPDADLCPSTVNAIRLIIQQLKDQDDGNVDVILAYNNILKSYSTATDRCPETNDMQKFERPRFRT